MSARKTFAMFLIGILAIQAAWIAAMPAFRGPDEFDHVFRSEGIAHGTFLPGDGEPGLVRGTLVPARRSVVEAATKTCLAYQYTQYYDCHPYDRTTGEWTAVGSGAGRYNPTYYLLAGNVGRFFKGIDVDYAIRAATGLSSALLLAWAATLWARAARSRWRTLGLLAALTPVLLFSTAIAAPNGISYAAGILLWVAGLVLVRSTGRPQPAPLAGAVTSAVVLCNTHTTGPLWLLLITMSLVLLEPARFRGLLADRRSQCAAALVGIGAIASVAWTTISGANLATAPVTEHFSPPIDDFMVQHVVWMLQSIAAFPLRNEPAPAVIYALWLLPFVLLLALAVRLRGRVLLTTAVIIAATLTVITVLTLVTYSAEGFAWQGRYGLPLMVGIVLVPAAYAPTDGPPRALFDSAAAAMVLATGISVWHIARHEHDFLQGPLTNHVVAGPVISGLVAATGFALLVRVLARGARTRQDDVTVDVVVA